jgi:hypothetical protein
MSDKLQEAIRKARESASKPATKEKSGSLADAIRKAQSGKTAVTGTAKARPIVVAADVFTPHGGL